MESKGKGYKLTPHQMRDNMRTCHHTMRSLHKATGIPEDWLRELRNGKRPFKTLGKKGSNALRDALRFHHVLPKGWEQNVPVRAPVDQDALVAKFVAETTVSALALARALSK